MKNKKITDFLIEGSRSLENLSKGQLGTGGFMLLEKWMGLTLSLVMILSSVGSVQAVEEDDLKELRRIEIPKINVNLNLDDLSCPMTVSFGALDELDPKDELTVKCWNSKPFTTSSPVEKLFKEKSICDCLKNSKHSAIKEIMSEEGAYGAAVSDYLKSQTLNAHHEASIRNDSEKSRQQFLKMFNDKANSFGFEASIISQGDPTFTASFAEVGKRMAESNSKAEENSLPDADSGSPTNVPEKDTEKAHHSELKTLNKKYKFNPKLFRDPKIDPESGQCVGGREFLAFKQLPNDQFLFKALSSRPFKSSDWDYDSLRKRFKDLTSKAPAEKKNMREEILTLKSKILFLGRNPLIKSIFAKRPPPPVGDDSDSVKIRSALNALDIQQEQENLYQIIASIVPETFSCRNGKGSEGSCLMSATKEDKIEKYRADLKSFFLRENVAPYTIYQSQLDLNQIIEDFRHKGGAYQSQLEVRSFDALEKDFMEKTGLEGPNTCMKNSVDIASCVRIYAPFCQRLSEVIQTIPNKDDDLIDDIDFLMKQNFDPNIKTNTELQAFNRDVCDTPRSKGLFSRSPALTFNQYRAKICQGQEDVRPECHLTSEGYASLRKKFFEEYPKGKETELSENELRAFIKHKVAQVNEASIKDIQAKGRSFSESIDSLNSLVGQKLIASHATKSAGNTPHLTGPGATGLTEMEEQKGRRESSLLPEELPLPSYAFPSGAMTANQEKLPSLHEKLTEEDKDRIRSLAEAEISRARKEVPTTDDPEIKSQMETRMKMLEELLAQKSETEAKYQKLIKELSKSENASEKSMLEAPSRAQGPRSSIQENTRFMVDESESDDLSGRGPASFQEAPKFQTSGSAAGGSGRVASSFQGGTTRVKGSSLGGANGALLDAAIAKGKVSSDGGTIIVQEAERGAMNAIETAADSGRALSLTVPSQAYAQFQSENVEVLKQYKEQILKNINENQAVRLTVKNGKQSMNIIVVNRNGQLVYLPSRVFSLKTLNHELQRTQENQRTP